MKEPKKDLAFVAASAVFGLGHIVSAIDRAADSLYKVANAKSQGNVDNSTHYHYHDHRKIVLHGYHNEYALGRETASLPRRLK